VLDAPSPANTWHHLVLTADGLALRLYVNGELKAASDYAGSLNNVDVIKWLSVGATLRDNQLDDTQDPPVTVQIDPPILDPDNGQVWGGLIDDVAVWARSLDGTEVRAIYTGGQGGQNAAAVASPLPDGEQTSAPELSAARDGNVLVLTYSGGTLVASDDVDGPYADVTGASSPQRVTMDQAARFYQVRR
jgi:Concanavalin A-like lectin/glucanases superfamily